jgi:glycosyltransferase involved in cell wall biosynthesis
MGAGPEFRTIESLNAATPAHVEVNVVGRGDVLAALDWSDALFLPSRTELNPIVVWEAWSRGRPVIASDIAALRDLAVVGPIWTFRDASHLRDLLNQMATDQSLRYSAVDRGPRVVSESNDQPRYVGRFLEG